MAQAMEDKVCGTNFKEAVLLFGACQETLRKEIAAGHFTLSHMGYFWCQGCSDYNWTAEKYVTNYLAMHNGLKSSLAFDTLYAEGHRRFVESLSSYARMFLGQMDKPDVD